MRHALSILILFFVTTVTAFSAVYTPAEIPNVQLADSTRLTVNPDGILSPAAEQQLDKILLDIRRTTTAEPVAVIIDRMSPDYDIDAFATELFEKWGIGKSDRDNGLLILVSKDDRKFVIRTGYGLEGALPDIVCGRIQRDVMAPAFRNNDFDGGMTAAAARIGQVLKDPRVRDEIVSSQKNPAVDDLTFADLMRMYVTFSVFLTALLLLYFIYKLLATRKMDRHDRYESMRKLQPVAAIMCFICLGMPLVVYVPVRILLDRWRNGPHRCPNCDTVMNKLDEETDNRYLTPSQDVEEKLNSVDYDVWLCPNCGETDIYAYKNPNTSLQECDRCGARACRLKCDRIILQPTTSREGRGVREYECMNCHNIKQMPYTIAKKAAAAPIIILPGGGRGGFGGGGFGGGGFGGGSTGGGGASGGW